MQETHLLFLESQILLFSVIQLNHLSVSLRPSNILPCLRGMNQS